MGSRSHFIGFVTVANLPQGTGRTGRLRTLAAALGGLGHRVVIWNEHGLEPGGGQLVTGELGGARFEYVLGTTERQWGFGAMGLKLKAVNQVLRKAQQAFAARELDLLIFNNLAFYDIFPITRLAHRLGIPTVQCYEDERWELVGKVGLAQRLFGWNSWLADRFCSPMADQLWVISSYLQQKYARLTGHPERIRLIPTIVDCKEWLMPPEPSHAVPVLLYSGGFGPQEDLEKLVQVLGCLKRQGLVFQMRFLGANSDNDRVKQLTRLVNEAGIQDRIEILGFCAADVVKQEVGNANILVNLRTNSVWSRSGLSTKLSENLAAGRTVLTSDVGDNTRYVEHGKSALVVSPDASAESVAELLKQALDRPEWRRALAAGGRKVALRHFDVPVVQKTMSEALAQLLDARPTGSSKS